MQYTISPNDIQLKASHEVSKCDFERELLSIYTGCCRQNAKCF